MSVITFDALTLAQKLRDKAKFPPEQAEQTAVVLAETFSNWQIQLQLATKAALNALKVDLDAVEAKLQTALAETKADLIKWVVGIGFAQVAMILAVLKLHV